MQRPEDDHNELQNFDKNHLQNALSKDTMDVDAIQDPPTPVSGVPDDSHCYFSFAHGGGPELPFSLVSKLPCLDNRISENHNMHILCNDLYVLFFAFSFY